jgi:atlastin
MENPLMNRTDWMGDPEEPLTGFQWKKSPERYTSGIVVWSDVFLHTTESNEDLAIILVDTQGLYDTKVSDLKVS